jgi:hypothetical protein
MAIVKISDLPLVDSPVEGTDLFVVVQDNVTKKAFASDIQTYVGFEEVQTATAGQTVFNLTQITYAAGANNLMVFVDGVNQYEGSSYTETDNNTVTFSQGLHEGALVKFSTVQTQTSEVADAGAVVYTPAGTGAVPTNVQAKLRETVSVKDFGAVGDGVTDDTAAIQAALDLGAAKIEFPAGSTYITTGNTFYSNQTLVIDGTLKLASGQPTGTTMLKNDDPIGGNSDIVITGVGTIDGNRANQTGSTAAVWHTLVYFENCQRVEFSVKNAKGNYYPRTVVSGTTGAVYAKDSSYVVFQNSTITDWSREGFWIENSNHSKMLNLIAIGGDDSYSGYQFSGDYNEADNLYVEGAGASGGSMDSRYSTFSNLVAKNCKFFWGWGFGHGGIPASYSVANNVVSINNGLLGTGSNTGGIGIVNNTEQFTLTNFYVANCTGTGLRCSAGADKIKIAHGRCTGNSIFGMVLFGASSAISFEVTDVDLRGNVSDPISLAGGSATIDFKKVTLSNDAFESTADISGISGGGTLVVSNGNARTWSNIIIFPANPTAAQAFPALNSKSSGQFTLGVGVTAGSSSFVRYVIL